MPTVPTDPQYVNQWHLTRIGNITRIWDDYRGNGITVGVYDDGIERNHADLNDNYNSALHVMFGGVTFDGNVTGSPDDAHGTSVAGLIGAEGNNGGTVGIAYESDLTGINIFDPTSALFINAATPTGFYSAIAQGANFDVVNHSWGSTPGYAASQNGNVANSFTANTLIGWDNAVDNGRGGFGTIVVKSAGNESRNASADGLNGSRFTVTVAASSNLDRAASYSNHGSSILVTAPGSETGVGSLGITTTDRTGTLGYNLRADPGANSDFTDDFGGTSAAAPIVSGVVTLMLDANELLGWRDVQNILSYSSTHLGGALDGSAQVANEDGRWQFNGAENWNGGGLHVHTNYGYGQVNVYNAVRMAEVWSLFNGINASFNEQSIVVTDNIALALPDQATVTKTFTVAAGIEIEHLALTINITHSFYDDLVLTLIAPDGTRVVLEDRSASDGTNADGGLVWTYGIDHLRGVTSGGVWTLEIRDTAAVDTGTLNSITATFYGTTADADDVYHFTDEFAAALALDASRRVLTDSDGGVDWINLAAVTGNIGANLSSGSNWTLNGAQYLQTGVGQNFENVVTGDGNDSIVGNALDNHIRGMRGDDFIDGGAGNDILVGGLGNDQLNGGIGNDTLTETSGSNSLNGGDGDDSIALSGTLSDFIDAGIGNDFVSLTNVTFVTGNLSGGFGTDRIFFNNVTLPGFFASSFGFEVISNLSTNIVNGNTDANGFDFSTMTLFAVNGLTVLQLAAGAGDDSVVGTVGNDDLRGDDGNDFLDGAGGNDILVGGLGNDQLNGGIGNDTLTETSGSNSLNGGDGDDSIALSGTLSDFIDAGIGNDFVSLTNVTFVTGNLSGGFGTDRIFFNNVTLPGFFASSFGFEVISNLSTNIVNGNTDANGFDFSTMTLFAVNGLTVLQLAAGAGDDSVVGTVGNDDLRGDDGNDFLDGAGGNDILVGGLGNDQLNGGIGNDTLTETSGSNSLNGGDGDDSIALSGTLSDFIDAGIGNDFVSLTNVTFVTGNLSGGFGTDRIFFNNVTLPGFFASSFGFEVISNLSTNIVNGNTDANGFDFSTMTLFAVNGLTVLQLAAGAGDDSVVGTVGNDDLRGDDGNDFLDGAGGNDILVGGLGNDQLNGGIGNDTLTETSGSNSLNGGDGDDSIALSGTLSDFIDAGIGNDFVSLTNVTFVTGNLSGGFGTDRIFFNNVTLPGFFASSFGFEVISNLSTNIVNGNTDANGFDFSTMTLFAVNGLTVLQLAAGAGDDSVVGTVGNDDLRGDDGNDFLDGAGGNDILVGGLGNDQLNGGLGNDIYVVDALGDTISESGGGGIDLVRTSVTWTLAAEFENLELTGAAAIDGTGNAVRNFITGNSNNNILDGGLGDDVIGGGMGNDIYILDSALDSVFENDEEGTDTVRAGFSYTLGEAFENLELQGSGNINGFGNALANDITGTSGTNRLDGGAGNDILRGGLGNDTYVVDSSADVIVEALNAGTDAVDSSAGSYTLSDNVELLILSGTAFDGYGNALANRIVGNSQNNILDGSAGADTLQGLGGNDRYVVDNVNDRVVETLSLTVGDTNDAGGYDIVEANVSYSLDSASNVRFVEELLFFGSANVNGTGNALNNLIVGNSGNNILDGGAGNDRLVGRDGNDIYLVDAIGDVVEDLFLGGTDTVRAAVTYTLSAHIENLELQGVANLNGFGNAENNAITGTSGNNRLDGLAGNDVLNGGLGADQMLGGAGDDQYFIDNGSDRVFETVTNNAADTNDATGIDHISTSITINMNSYNGIRFVENATLTGTADLSLTGNALANTLTGNFGRNTLDGGAGVDLLRGGRGDDTYIVDNIADVADETGGDGVDTIRSSVNWTLGAGFENLELTGTAFNGIGNALNNRITGNASDNQLNGGAGTDTLVGGAGNDTYIVDSSGDRIIETITVSQTATNDAGGFDQIISSVSVFMNAYSSISFVEAVTLTGTALTSAYGNARDNTMAGNNSANTLDGFTGNDSLTGNGGNDTLIGGMGSDTLNGGADRDRLTGGAGQDFLTGGTQDDVFVFGIGDMGTSQATADQILDWSGFAGGQNDRIDLSAIDANTANGAGTNEAFAFIGGAAFGNIAGQLRTEVIGGNTFLMADLNGDGVADLFLRLNGVVTVGAGDIAL